jgi:hypothetical protein
MKGGEDAAGGMLDAATRVEDEALRISALSTSGGECIPITPAV